MKMVIPPVWQNREIGSITIHHSKFHYISRGGKWYAFRFHLPDDIKGASERETYIWRVWRVERLRNIYQVKARYSDYFGTASNLEECVYDATAWLKKETLDTLNPCH